MFGAIECLGRSWSCSQGDVRPWLLMIMVLASFVLYHKLKAMISKKGSLSMRQKLMRLIIPGVLIAAVVGWAVPQAPENASKAIQVAGSGLPRLLDLGADKCIPCKRMAPILETMKEEFTGRLQVDFIDVWKNPNEAPKYQINTIPTQIFFDAQGKELWRHVGFISKEDILAKWTELGYEFKTAELAKIERWKPVKQDIRSKDQICYMCDGDINSKTLVIVKTDGGDVRLCSPHCYFIMFSCLTEDKTDFH